jgi:hypothetical protein
VVLVLALAAAVLTAGDLAGVGVAMAQPAWPSDAAEIPTDGRFVEAVGPAPLGRMGAVLQVIVVLVCPATCLAMGLLECRQGRRRPDAGFSSEP